MTKKRPFKRIFKKQNIKIKPFTKNYLLYRERKFTFVLEFFNAIVLMQAYKFNTRISEKGVISLPQESALFDREVEIIVIPKLGKETIPAGYMTLEEFRSESKISLTKILNEHGIH